MSGARYQRIRALFEAALERDDHGRSAFLDEACRDDPVLRMELEQLLTAHTESTLLMSQSELVPARVESGPSLLAGSRLFAGRFEIEVKLGEGGMGQVYRARDRRLGRTVALKVLPGGLAEQSEFRRRLEREARALSSLSHPNICGVYDLGNDEGLDYLVL